MSDGTAPAESGKPLTRPAGVIRAARLLMAAAVMLFTLHASARLYRLVDAHAVNVYFADQWMLTFGMFQISDAGAFGEPSLFKLLTWNFPQIPFLQQGGAWFMGLGAPFTELVYGMSRWNTRVESFAIYGVLVAAMLGALRLKVLLYGRLTLTDAAIPLLFLSPRHMETLTGTPFASHSALPLLLVVAYCFCLVGPRTIRKYAALLVVNALITFTGNGFIVGALTPVLLALEGARAMRRRSADGRLALAAAAIAALTLVAWWVPLFAGIVPPCFRFPHQPFSDYLRFLANVFAMFLGLDWNKALPFAAGSAVALTMAVVPSYQLAAIVRSDDRTADRRLVVAVLGLFTLGFCAATAIGRVCLGLHPSGRYMTLLVPGFLALYFALLSIGPVKVRAAMAAVFAAVLLMRVYPVNPVDRVTMAWFRDIKREWMECYLATRSSAECSVRVPTVLPPDFSDAVKLPEQLRLLEQHRLGFFADAR